MNLQPWLDCFATRDVRRRSFFTRVFNKLSELGYTLENQDGIEGGYRLSFQRGNAWVIADRYMSFAVAGETSGISLYNESEEWEAKFSARSPINLVLSAIDNITQEDESPL